MPILQVNSCSIDQESGEIWAAQADLQLISPKSDRLLEYANSRNPVPLCMTFHFSRTTSDTTDPLPRLTLFIPLNMGMAKRSRLEKLSDSGRQSVFA